jgi:hypothetical protein
VLSVDNDAAADTHTSVVALLLLLLQHHYCRDCTLQVFSNGTIMGRLQYRPGNIMLFIRKLGHRKSLLHNVVRASDISLMRSCTIMRHLAMRFALRCCSCGTCCVPVAASL